MSNAVAPQSRRPRNKTEAIIRRKSQHGSAEEDAEAARQREREARQTYDRGQKIDTRRIKDKKLRSSLKRVEEKYTDAMLKAKDAEILLENDAGFLEPEDELERTWRVRQDAIRQDVGIETAKKGFELKLEEMGPYVSDYSRNGRDLLLAGRKGHIATMDWRAGKIGCELQLRETVRDAKWLHNNQSFAVAQKKNVYIYNQQGVEIHRLPKHTEVTHMEFLPYHFLLATIGTGGHLKYMDTSMGHMVAEHSTKLGTPTSMCQNPWNAVVHVGHQNGTVTLWSPTTSTPLVKLLPQRGPVRALAVDRSGNYMVSAGQDCRMSVWDIRNFKEVNNYFTRQPASSIAISDRNLTAVGWGTQVTIWRDLFSRTAMRSGTDHEKIQSPYMSWGGEGQSVSRVRWCPFEDVLGVAHSSGFTSAIVPGAGEPNFDALEVNPYETVKQRQEGEVKQLLNKLSPDMIALDPNFIGNVDLVSAEKREAERDLDRKPEDIVEKLRKKARGKNSALKRHLRKKGGRNIVTFDKLRVQEALKANNKKVMEKREAEIEKYGPALARFAQKTTR